MKRALFFLAAALVMGTPARSDDAAGSTSAEFLRFGSGARGPAVGDAWTAGAEGIDALVYNPAAMAWSNRMAAGGSYQEIVLGIGHGTLGFVDPIGRNGTWGVGVTYLDYGTTTRTTIADGAAPTFATAGSFDGSDLAVGISYGHRLGERWSAGLTLKGISSSIDDVDATAFAADLGLHWKPTPWLRAGLAVRNIGTQLKYDRTEEELPLLVRGGVAASIWDNRLRLYAEGEKTRDDQPLFFGGAEYWIADVLALRAGYDGRLADIDNGLTAGIGVRWEDFEVDYAYLPYGKIGETHRLGLTVQFGQTERQEPPAR